MASGMNGVNDMDNATFKVYEDGRVEMMDAVVRGYVHQFHKSQEVVQKSVYANTGGNPLFNGNIELDSKKVCNYIQLAWEGLFQENRYRLDLTSATLNNIPPGRIVFLNTIYTKDNGISYYNKWNKKTSIKVNLLTLDGVLRKAATITLLSGWVELSRMISLDANNGVIQPSSADLGAVYILHSYGGNVVIDTDTVFSPTVNTDSAITNFDQTVEYSPSRFVNSGDTVFRVYPQNKSIYIGYGTPEDAPLYIVLPYFHDLYGTVYYHDSIEPVSWMFLISDGHREVIFKKATIGTQYTDEDVPNLETIGPTIPAKAGNLGNIYFRITYYPFFRPGGLPEYIVEKLDSNSTI